jgi:hypothetical protein
MPAGIEKFFEEVSVPALDRSSPPPGEQEDLDRIMASAPKYGVEIRLPSETQLSFRDNTPSRHLGE